MSTHTCQESDTCTCYALALEPKQDCPVHGYPWPPRCGECGKYLPWARPASTEGRSEGNGE